MTTLVAMLTKDALVMGADSLGTQSASFVDPFDLSEYFDPDDDYNLRMGPDGEPLLKSFHYLWDRTREVPVNHMTHVDKLFDLGSAGVMLTGLASIGNSTIKRLISNFREKNGLFVRQTITSTEFRVEKTAQQLLEYLKQPYLELYPEEYSRPIIQMFVGGFDRSSEAPQAYWVLLPQLEVVRTSGPGPEGFGPVVGGEVTELQRIGNGTDDNNKQAIETRYVALLSRFAEEVAEVNDADVSLPDIEEYTKKFSMFGPIDPDDPDGAMPWSLEKFAANWAEFSEQNAIDCVSFFIDIMIKGQQFKSGMPTVGGKVKIALITKEDGFRFVSEDTYSHQDHSIAKTREIGGSDVGN